MGPQGRSVGVRKICPHRDSIPGPPSSQRVAIPTTLSRPTNVKRTGHVPYFKLTNIRIMDAVLTNIRISDAVLTNIRILDAVLTNIRILDAVLTSPNFA